MKNTMRFALVFLMALGSSSYGATEDSRAREDQLDQKTFCRTVISDGMFGQPKGERSHCVGFQEGQMIDNSNTFFGNPPESHPYRIKAEIIEILQGKKWKKSDYSIDGEDLIYNKQRMKEKKIEE